MPPRKRTASATETTEEPQAPEVEAPDGPDAGAPTDEEAAPDAPESNVGPGLSDLQAVEQPCRECMPNGWPAQAYAVGCTHGTWQREALD